MGSNIERQALFISALSAGLFAISGLIIGLWSGSVMILFDSAYSLLSLALASLSLLALKLANQPADGQYPFGRLTIEPIAVLVKGIVMALVCLFSVAFATMSLLQGGREVNIDIALAFGLINVTGCAITWALIHHRQKQANTALLRAELRQWQMDTWLSAAVLLGFIIAFLIKQSPFAPLARFADPLMVLIIGTCFSVIPIKMITQAVKEILFASPSAEIQNDIKQRMHLHGLFLDEPLRSAQVGSFLVAQLPPHINLAQSKKVRQELNELSKNQQLKLIMIQGLP
ncbi:cation diffusion facilitator family transporter [Methylophaga sp.]|uniref:cation diffusion facilitator family transporter n=1 Tax=Methylophaga sp. TaxID=2024840 RepID=UPI00271B91B4|nr:cation diffusion facilitator family transporter [Methylophaga sp.]MDO8827560.1 cation diffusion facilitator family transporter [Methylophaga sp.]